MKTLGKELENILADAFRPLGGIALLNGIVEPSVGISITRDVASEYTAMGSVIAKLAQKLEEKGEPWITMAVVACYRALPGDERLRHWVRDNLSEADYASVPEELFLEQKAAYEESRRVGWNQSAAVSGLKELRERADETGVAALIAEFGSKLDLTIHQLQLMNLYKQIHDGLHTIQTKPFSRFGAMLLQEELDESDVAEIAEHLGEIANEVARIRASVVSVQLLEEPLDDRWVGVFKQALASLEPPAKVDRSALRAVTSKLRSVLGSQLKALNSALIEAAGRIPLIPLAQLLTKAAAQMEDPAGGKLLTAAAAIDQIAQGLIAAVAVHDDWQDLDMRLWGFELAYPLAIYDADQRSEVRANWSDMIVPLMETLREADPTDWSRIDDGRAEFERALNDEHPDLAELGRTLLSFATALRVRFFQVDRALLDQCTSLMPMLPELRALARGGKAV